MNVHGLQPGSVETQMTFIGRHKRHVKKRPHYHKPKQYVCVTTIRLWIFINPAKIKSLFSSSDTVFWSVPTQNTCLWFISLRIVVIVLPPGAPISVQSDWHSTLSIITFLYGFLPLPQEERRKMQVCQDESLYKFVVNHRVDINSG